MAGLKFPNFNQAPGYWGGPGPWRRVQADQTAAKIRTWHQDQLIALGKQCFLWTPVNSLTPGAVPCTCVKDTTSDAQRGCYSCNGSKLVPGYLKFSHQTIFFSSAEAGSFTLNNAVVSTNLKPNLIQIAPGSFTGIITTGVKPYTFPTTTPNGVLPTWQVNTNAFIRAPGSTIQVSFSTDGVNYYDVSLINGPNQPNASSGSIQFQITMSRASVTDPSPGFEITRLRRPLSENMNPNILAMRPGSSYAPGQILILKTWVRNRTSLLEGRGKLTEHMEDRSWTVPLDFFDTSIHHDTTDAIIGDRKTGVHAFIEYQGDGVQSTTRYMLESINFNTQLGLFTQQTFVERFIQPDETDAFLVF